MDWAKIKSNWLAFTPAILERWPQAREVDVENLTGDRDEFATYLAARTGGDPQDMLAEIDAWQMGEIPADIVMDEHMDNERIRASASHIGEGEDALADDQAFGDEEVPERPLGRS